MSSQKVRVPTETDEHESEHPIDGDIVRAAANECNVDPDVLDDVLTACSRLWDPHRDRLSHVLDVFYMYGEHRVTIEGKTDNRIILGGYGFTPSMVVHRVSLYSRVEFESVTPAGMALAVSVAHSMQAERLNYGDHKINLIIRRP